MTKHQLAQVCEYKAGGDLAEGEFEGYGAIFNNVDSHGDMISPGAFKSSLAERKAQGRGLPPMYEMHGGGMFGGGNPRPVGVWSKMSDDGIGLHVRGKLSGLDTENGKSLYGLMKDGAMKGLSIGYSVAPGGAKYAQNPGEPSRVLNEIKLHEVSIVDEASNALAKVRNMKRVEAEEALEMLDAGDVEGLRKALAEEEPTERAVKALMREHWRLSRSQADRVWLGFKSASSGDQRAAEEPAVEDFMRKIRILAATA